MYRMKIFYFSQPTNCGKKPFPEVDHLRKRLLFLYIDRKPPLPDRIAGKGGFFISENGIW